MYIHIGGDTVIERKSIVGIMEIENTSTSKITKDFFRKNGKKVINISDDLPRSFIITKDNNKSKIYISPISTATLYKRCRERKIKENG
ncbi:MAG: DUF370 domain-containing protein [Clostridia bacterium]|nr:DUF370 domain-containing protein [Clostridia bacterium]